MITLNEFLSAIQRNAERINRYELGNDGNNGTCDCIGLIIGAVRLCGAVWPGIHGSNWAARNAVLDLHEVTKASQLRLGDLVFKGRQPGENNYALPAKYKASGDLTDYYHVGVVTSIDPLRITHCTSVAGGIKTDTALGKWHYAGWLNLVEQGGESEPMYTATVYAENGKPVNLRKSASSSAKVIELVPCGAEVEVLEEVSDKWAKINDHGVVGYMMRAFLKDNGDFSGSDSLFVMPLEDAKALRESLLNALEILHHN